MENNLKNYIYIYIHTYIYIYIYKTESLCCTPENNTAVQINSTPVKQTILKRVNILEGMTKKMIKLKMELPTWEGWLKKISQCR